MTALDFSTVLGNAWFPAPIFTASGCASSGRELSQFFDISTMGGVVTKSVMLKARNGRATPRMAETPSGMLNSIGLQGPGIDAFLAKDVVGRLFAVGKWTPELGCVMFDRSDDRKGAEAIIKVIRNVKSGSAMVVFPEGTRSKEIGTLLEFKQGSFKVALKSKSPLVPMTIVKPKNYENLFFILSKKCFRF